MVGDSSSLLASVRRSLEPRDRILLAVSGGVDSMVLLHATAAVAPRHQRVVVAAFDHGTGEHARRAVNLVRHEARRLGFGVSIGRACTPRPSEAAWRTLRWQFLRSVSRRESSAIVTAHTLDDQIETVVMRLLRHSGAHGLAGLLATSDILRPLIETDRETVLDFARSRGVRWIEDPSNSSPAFLRNRVRHDLLPALEQVQPGFRGEIAALSRRAADLRHSVEALLEVVLQDRSEAGGVAVDLELLNGLDAKSLRFLFPPLLARAGIILDWRGLERLVSHRLRGSARPRSRVPLSGGGEVLFSSRQMILRRRRPGRPSGKSVPGNQLRCGDWRFRPLSGATIKEVEDDPWREALPVGRRIEIRPWEPGDRMLTSDAGTFRRVKRFLREAKIPSADRQGWPVVLVDGVIVWIPGVRRSDAATVRSGGPHMVYHCERNVG